MGGKSKKLIYVPTPQGKVGEYRWQVGRSKGLLRLPNPREIFAHNGDKRKKIMFISDLGGFG